MEPITSQTFSLSAVPVTVVNGKQFNIYENPELLATLKPHA